MGMDTLKLQQLSSLLTQMGEGAATYNPVQQSQLRGLTASAQSSISAEAEKKAKEEAKKRKGSIGKAITGAAKGGMQGFMLGGPWGAVAGAGVGAAGGATGYDQEIGAIGDTATMGKNMGMFGGDKVNLNPDSIDAAAMATETPSAPIVTQGTPVPQAPPVQVKALPKPTMAAPAMAPAAAQTAPPAMAPAAGSTTMPAASAFPDFNVSAAALAGLTALTMARADDRKTPMNLTQGAQVRPGGLRGNSMPQIPTDGKPITLAEAKRRGFDQQQIAVLRKQGLISGTDPKDIAVAGLAATGAGLLAGGSKNA